MNDRRARVTARELAMRCLLLVQAAHNGDPAFSRAVVARAIVRRFHVSRATAYRYVAAALDIVESRAVLRKLAGDRS
jgi:hypothetical protein